MLKDWCRQRSIRKVISAIIKLVSIEACHSNNPVMEIQKEIDVDLLMKAELATVRLAQKSFQAPIEQLKKGMLSRMDPFVDDDGIIRVGGSITNSTLPWKLKHPAIMPKKHSVIFTNSTLSREDSTRWTRRYT